MRRPAGEILFNIANTAFMLLLMMIMFYPFWYIFVYSLSDSAAVSRGISLLPQGITLANYRKMLAQPQIYSAAFISAARTVSGTALTVFSCSMFAYVLTKKLLPLRRLIYRLLILTMYLQAGLIPWYMLMKWLGLQNNFLLYILPTAIAGFYVIIIKTYIEQLPGSLEESAFMDGAGYMTIFVRIILPLCKPTLATVGIFAAVQQWNLWHDNMFLCTKDGLQTLQLILYRYLMNNAANLDSIKEDIRSGAISYKLSPMSVRMTVTMLVTLPVLMVYPFFQRYFIKGLLLGSIKG